ncbi:DUF421 domain-containing protein [Neobacillus sp. 114]|uniref:DUF421 domain-containing protein n=1 Tax=Neobacillus sp. 114 TaxID=3048535 RepID=UPI0024C405DA|nr:DUF421 domain-containing protein [Neobacillus sp. 114]
MQGAIEVILRTFTAFILLWLFVMVLGKQTIAHRSYHLYIASITMGTIAGNLAFNVKVKFLYFIIAIILMGTIVFMLNWVTVQKPHIGKWIAGEPATLIQNGQILKQSMEQMGYSLQSLKQALRAKDIFNIEEVECAILETNGSLSILKKEKYQNATKQDLNLLSPTRNIPVEMIYNGEILYANLTENGYDEEWIMTELKRRKLDVNDISYAVIGTKGNLYIELFRMQLK